MQYDAFISHASEDKREVARPLAERLAGAGLRVWLDAFELTVGDNLRREIDKGLSRSRFGIVILSPSFLSKEWPQKELDALVARDDGKHKVILPVLHNLSKSDIEVRAPLLAGKLAVSTASGLKRVAEELIRAINKEPTPTVTGSSPAGPKPPDWSSILKPKNKMEPEEPKGLEQLLPGRWIVRLEGRSESNTGTSGVGKGMFGLGYDAFVQLHKNRDFHANTEQDRASQPWMAEGLWKLLDAHTLRINWCKHFGPEKWYRQTFHLMADSGGRLSGTIDDVHVQWLRAH